MSKTLQGSSDSDKPQNAVDTKGSFSLMDVVAPEVKDVLLTGNVPARMDLLKLLLKLSRTQLAQASGNMHRVAIIGPANAGKSTLYNQFILNRGDKAAVSPIPGTTRVNQQAEGDLFQVVDTPGADAAGETGEQERINALAAAQEADLLIILFDATQGIRRSEVALFTEMSSLKKPYVVALNKMDDVRKHAAATLQSAAKNLGLRPEQIIPISAARGENLNHLVLAIAAQEPQITAALGQALPQYRWLLATRVITGASSLSAVIALTPLPVLDFFPLLINQFMMLLGIARVYHVRMTFKRLRELGASFGMGLLGRTLFVELSKFGGVPGWLLSAAIAASVTAAMGYTAAIWFERGEKLSRQAFEKVSRALTANILDRIKHLGKSRPNRKDLNQVIAETLQDMPLNGEVPGDRQHE